MDKLKSNLEKLLDFSNLKNKQPHEYNDISIQENEYNIIFNEFYKIFNKLLDCYKIKLINFSHNISLITIEKNKIIGISYGDGYFKIILNEKGKKVILYSIAFLLHNYLFNYVNELIKLSMSLRNKNVKFIKFDETLIYHYGKIQPCEYDFSKEFIKVFINLIFNKNIEDDLSEDFKELKNKILYLNRNIVPIDDLQIIK